MHTQPHPPTRTQIVVDYFNSRLDAIQSAPRGKGGKGGAAAAADAGLTTSVRPPGSQPDWSVREVGGGGGRCAALLGCLAWVLLQLQNVNGCRCAKTSSLLT